MSTSSRTQVWPGMAKAKSHLFPSMGWEPRPALRKAGRKFTGRPSFDGYEVTAKVWMRGPKPKFQTSCDPLCAKQVADFFEGPYSACDPLCSAHLPAKCKTCCKSLGAKQVAGFFEARDCGRDPLCKDHFLYKLKIGCNPFTTKQVA